MAKAKVNKPKKGNKTVIKNKSKLSVEKQKIPRHREKFAALNFKRQVKTRLDQLDIDYVDKLNDKEKAWLNSFLEETVITNFQHKGKKHYKTKKSKREFYNSNNARNRCMFTKAKAMGTLVFNNNPSAFSSLLEQADGDATDNRLEDAFIEYFDSQKDTESKD